MGTRHRNIFSEFLFKRRLDWKYDWKNLRRQYL